jgi:SAM-dependent methyltransferase
MNDYSPKEYWTTVAETFRSADPAGFAPVLHPGAPPWFNSLIDRLQLQAMQRALRLAQIPPGARFLDVGCGTGRWLRRYQQIGFHPAGLDVTPGMLRTARQQGTTAPLIAGEAYRLPFAGESFDAVSDVTVVQHIPAALQPQALAEMLRVLKPGGNLILMELIQGRGEHIFPRDPQDWIRQVTSSGATLLGWFGQEFLFLDRLFVRVAQKLKNPNANPDGLHAPPAVPPAQPDSSIRRAYWSIRHFTAPLSAWSDPLTEKLFPGRFATHGVFVFRK